MNTNSSSMLTKLLIPSLSLILGTTCLQGKEFVDTMEQTFPISVGGQLKTQLEDANITVTSHDKEEVYVHITRKVEGKSEEEAQEIFAKHLVEFESNSDSLSITTHREDKKSKLWRFRNGSFEVDFVIRVPQQTNTQLNTVDGDVSISDITGDSTIHTVDGDLAANDLSGNWDLKTVDGDVVISNLVGPLAVRSVDGDLTLNNIQGSIQAKTIDGDVEIELTGQPEEDSKIESTDGDVELTLNEGIGVTIDATALDGSVRLPFVAETIQKRGDRTHIIANAYGGGPTITIKSVDGDIAAN